jgi:hypothetical protein
VQHVWLDGKVEADGPDGNLEKINALAAWSAGSTGKGVKVVVDTTHPDLAGQVGASVNFSRPRTAPAPHRTGSGPQPGAVCADGPR